LRYITPFILIFILITVFTSAGANTTENTTAENVTIKNTGNNALIQPMATEASITINPTYLDLGTVDQMVSKEATMRLHF